MRGALLLVLVAACAGARADDVLYVQVPAVLHADAPVAEAVFAECNVESMVGNYVYSGVKRRYPSAQILRGASDGTELRLIILGMRGVGPGPWTQKSIELRADLVREGKVIDSNVFHREAGGSGFGRIRGTCDFFARLATMLGRDVANWLAPALARAPAVAPAAPNDVKLEQLQKLREEGLISRAEYEQNIAIALLLAAASAPAFADIDRLQLLTQPEFRALAEDMSAALSYKPLQPIEPLGFPGFDVGVAATGTKIKHQDLWIRATGDSDFPSTVVVPSVRASIGLPWNFDLSAMYSEVPKTGVSLAGGALSWALYGGSTWLPALGVRASYTKMFGVDQLDFNSSGLDASISKGFGPFTPYLGAGKIWSKATPQSTTILHPESFSQTKVFGGVAIKVTVVNLVVEYDRTGTINSYGAKLGLRF